MSPAQNADPAETGSMMEQLGELIHKSLRQCDAMARYSENQYVLLISGNSSAENGSTPLERIKAAFYRMPAHGRYLLNYHMYAPRYPRPLRRRPEKIILGNTAQFPPDGLSTAPAAAARQLPSRHAPPKRVFLLNHCNARPIVLQ